MIQVYNKGAIKTENQSEVNKKAWSYRVYEFWNKEKGSPSDVAKEMIENPKKYLRKHIDYLGDVKGKKIINLLGSNGRKAVPLALLGANVTVVDISPENHKYAMELAREANVDLTYLVSDLLEIDTSNENNNFDIAYAEGGILHYFSDLDTISNEIYKMLKFGGRLVLNDFHPFRKILNISDIYVSKNKKLEIQGDYFDSKLISGNVAHRKFFSEKEQSDFPDCLLRFWTMGDIITSFATAGFIIEKFIEIPRDDYETIPGEFILVASKFKIEK